MKKLLFSALFALSMLAPTMSAQVSSAAEVDVINPICFRTDANGNQVPLPDDQKPAICKESENATGNPLFGPDGILTKVIKIMSLIVGVTAVIVIMIGGIKFATSNGDPSKVASARQTIIFASVGVVVAALAQVVVRFILSKAG